tara:strand:- start:397 stop:978 length:582 start_codon:yes stop_codon:yes gene_type:complete
MNFSKTILFLGYDKSENSLMEFLTERGHEVLHSKKKINSIENFDLVVSYGYRYIIPKKVLSSSTPIINLHMSFLPFNRGAHPNFWSHFDNTPSGVTIHLIDEGIDTGDCLFQKKVFINKEKMTFLSSYLLLKEEIEDLFKKNYESIINLDFKPKKYSSVGTFHLKKDLPKNFAGWNEIISEEINRLKLNREDK